ncbi:MAG: aromatic-ring-hydroxylating dioxygenase subunit beta, partial [Pseudomonadota bacterium]|nr:aromatic-ring-hydroxylating dioxygenase subunit beta [Pseudomonadota bacterium]
MPLAIMRCESRAMMQDRVRAIRETLMFEPRYIRHLISSIRIRPEGDGMVSVTANYAVLETLMDEMTKVLNAGRYVDKLVREDGELRFKEKRCVYDSSVVPNSLVYPV